MNLQYLVVAFAALALIATALLPVFWRGGYRQAVKEIRPEPSTPSPTNIAQDHKTQADIDGMTGFATNTTATEQAYRDYQESRNRILRDAAAAMSRGAPGAISAYANGSCMAEPSKPSVIGLEVKAPHFTKRDQPAGGRLFGGLQATALWMDDLEASELDIELSFGGPELKAKVAQAYDDAVKSGTGIFTFANPTEEANGTPNGKGMAEPSGVAPGLLDDVWLTWDDGDGSSHYITIGGARKLLKRLFDEWPGGLDEIAASVEGANARSQMLLAAKDTWKSRAEVAEGILRGAQKQQDVQANGSAMAQPSTQPSTQDHDFHSLVEELVCSWVWGGNSDEQIARRGKAREAVERYCALQDDKITALKRTVSDLGDYICTMESRLSIAQNTSINWQSRAVKAERRVRELEGDKEQRPQEGKAASSCYCDIKPKTPSNPMGICSVCKMAPPDTSNNARALVSGANGSAMAEQSNCAHKTGCVSVDQCRRAKRCIDQFDDLKMSSNGFDKFWRALCDILDKASPGWAGKEKSGYESALRAVNDLAKWHQAIDSELMATHLGTTETFGNLPEQCLAQITNWHVGVATDPAVNGGFKLVPVELSVFEGVRPSADYVLTLARDLVADAKKAGFIVTIEQRPLQPLSMGHHESVVSVREARSAA